MQRAFFMGFALVAYTIFFLTFLYLIAFVGDLPWVARTVDRGPDAPLATALIVNVVLIALFGVQHSVMARQGFKRAWTKIVPKSVERSIYVLAASAVLVLLFLLWRPIEGVVWETESRLLSGLLWLLFGAGWGIVLLSTFLINHFELFGLQQAWFNLRGRVAAAPQLRQPFFYKLVRHPLYAGFFLAFWATPQMTVGHLLLALGMSVYMLIAIRYEELDLVGLFGEDYERYQREVGMLVPGIGRRTAPPAPTQKSRL